MARGAALAVDEVRALHALSEQTRPLTLAKERVLPVRSGLADLLPFGGLRRGTVVQVDSPTLVFALVAVATVEGSWAAFVGTPSLGLAAASGQGVAIERVVTVAAPPPELAATVVAALIDALDLVVVGPKVMVRAADARRLAARARERGGVLLSLGPWPEATDLRVKAARHHWGGLDHGHGHLRTWTVDVVVEGRGAASQGRRGLVRLARSADDLRADDLRANDLRANDLVTTRADLVAVPSDSFEQAG